MSGVGVNAYRRDPLSTNNSQFCDFVADAPWIALASSSTTNELEDTMNHTDDCTGGKTCAPIDGIWDQPDGFSVQLAEGGNDEPWCVTRRRAMALMMEAAR